MLNNDRKIRVTGSSIKCVPKVPMKMRRLNPKVKFKSQGQFLRSTSGFQPCGLNLTLRFNLRIFIGTFRRAFYTTSTGMFHSDPVFFCRINTKYITAVWTGIYSTIN